MNISETFYGMAGVRKAKRLADKHGWQCNVVPNANGLRGMYARTDAVLIRPATRQQALDRLSQIEELLDRAAVVNKIAAIVPADVLQAGVMNCRGKPRISREDCSRLKLAQPREGKRGDATHCDLSLILQINFPALNSYQRKLIYQSLRTGGGTQQFRWCVPDNEATAELQQQQSEIKAYLQQKEQTT